MPDCTYTGFLAKARVQPPQVAIILGSGLGAVARRVRTEASLSFDAIPGLGGATISGHDGRVSLGTWAAKRVLIFEGRLHFYEGHSWDTVTLPVRTAADLGARFLLLTNAAGGIAAHLQPQCLMAIHDHFELNRHDCWRECSTTGIGDHLSSPYSARMRRWLQQAASRLNMTLHEGIYAAVTGPCYETPAEICALKSWGADAVGMSTSREIMMGHACGMECAAISCITNMAAGLSCQPVEHREVLAGAAASAERLADLLEEFLGLVEG